MLRIEGITELASEGGDPVAGVTATDDDGPRVLVTHAAKGVALWDLRARCCVATWTQPPGAGHLTSSAVLHAPTRAVVAARGNRLVAWDASSSAAAARTSKPLPAPVHGVFAAGGDDSCVAVVLRSGAVLRCAVLAPALETRAECPPLQQQQLLPMWATALHVPSAILVGYAQPAAVRIVPTPPGAADGVWGTDASLAPLHQQQQKKKAQDASAETAAVVAYALERSSATLAAVFADGTWATFHVRVPERALVPERSGSLACFDFSSSGVAMGFAARRDVLLLAGTLSDAWADRPGLPSPGSRVVMAVETLYGTAHAVRQLPSPAEPSQLLAVAGDSGVAALIASGDSGALFACDVHVAHVTLGAAISNGLPTAGTARTRPLTTLADVLPPGAADVAGAAAVAESEVVAEAQAVSIEDATAAWAKRVSMQNEHEEAAIAKILDPEASAESVAKVIFEMLSKKKEAVVATETKKEQNAADGKKKKKKKKKTTMKSSRMKGREAVSFCLVQSVARRVCSEADPHTLWSPMRELLKLRVVTHSAAPGLLSACLAKHFLWGLEDCLLNMRDIPDDEIARLLKYVLTDVPLSALTAFDPKHHKLGRGGSDLETVRKYLLTLVLRLPRNEVFAHRFAKSLTTSEVVYLLEFLAEWLRRARNESVAQMRRNKSLGGAIPTVRQVTGWVETVLDAHIASLVLLKKECAKPLADISKCLREELALCDAAKTLAPYLEQLSHPNPLPHQQISEYQIEVMRF